MNKKKSSNKKAIEYINIWKFKIRKSTFLIITAFLSSILLIVSTYAWFFASLDVRISSLNMTVSDESGLFISLDGINWSSSVSVSKDILFKDLNRRYPNHISQWPSSMGMYPVSTNGIASRNDNTFNIFTSEVSYKNELVTRERVITTYLYDEPKASQNSNFVAFDIFLKNVTGSPYEDNVFLDEGTEVKLLSSGSKDSDGSINSIRVGFLKMNTISKRSSINAIQNITCNNNCVASIWEPHSKEHSKASILKALKHNVRVVDGVYTPTYGVIAEGEMLEMASGQEGSGIPLDTEHFALQNTITDLSNRVFGLSTGITKVRVYIWVEGQDIDSIETQSQGANIEVSLNFYKDLAGYYQ